MSRVLTLVAAVGFGVAVLLWEFGAHRTLSHIGRWAIHLVTFGRVRLSADRIDDTAEISVGAATLLFFFLLLIFLSSVLL